MLFAIIIVDQHRSGKRENMDESITDHDLPLGVEVRHLAALDAIARTRSFSQAGALLGYAQSAVSQQIATLERVVGHRLVERPGGPRPVSLTRAGEVLLRHAAHITARLGALKADLDAMDAGAGTLTVATFQSASNRLLPPTLQRFRELWPLVDVELVNHGATQLDLVSAGRVDLAFSEADGITPPLASAALMEDPYVVMLPLDHPLAGADEIDLLALDGALLVAAPAACGTRVAESLQGAGVAMSSTFRSDDNLTTQRLVASGLGISISPLLSVELFVPDAPVAVVPLAPRHRFSRTISIVWHGDRERSPATESFVEVAIDVAATIGLPTLPATTSDPSTLIAPARLDDAVVPSRR